MAFSSTWKTLNRPPLVVFTLCLTAFSLTTLCLAYYIRNTDNLINPNVDWEWKHFFKHLSSLDLCLYSPTSSLLDTTITTTSSSSSTPNDNTPPSTNDFQLPHSDDEVNNVTIMFGLSFRLEHFLTSRWPPNVTFVGNIDVSGWTSCGELVNNGQVELALYFARNLSQEHQICARFTGPKSLLPPTPTPNFIDSSCTSIIHSTSNDSTVARLEAQQRYFENDNNLDFENQCENEGSTLVRIDSTQKPKLTIYLTMHDRSMINLHLMHTTYFLMVMAATIVCYALIRGRAKKSVSEKVLLET